MIVDAVNTVRLEVLAQLRGHDSPVWNVNWRNETELASCGGKRVLLWKYLADNQEWYLKSIVYNREESEEVPSNYLDHKDDPKLVTFWGGRVYLQNEETHTRITRSVSWSNDQKTLAVACFDATVSLWEEEEPQKIEDKSSTNPKSMSSWKLKAKLGGHDHEVKHVTWSPNNAHLATCSRDKAVWIYSLISDADIQEFVCTAILRGHSQDVKYVAWHPRENLLISTSYDNTIRVWAPKTDQMLNDQTIHNDDQEDDDEDEENAMQGNWRCIEVLLGHGSTVWQASFSPTGLEFASCSDDKTVRIWTAQAKQTNKNSQNPFLLALPSPKTLQLHPWVYVIPTFRLIPRFALLHKISLEKNDSSLKKSDSSPDHSSSSEFPLALSSVWTCTATIDGYHDRCIYSVAWHPKEDVIATACGDDGIRLFARTIEQTNMVQSSFTWSLISHLPLAHVGDVNSVSWKKQPEDDGGWLLASGGGDCVIKILKYTTNTKYNE